MTGDPPRRCDKTKYWWPLEPRRKEDSQKEFVAPTSIPLVCEVERLYGTGRESWECHSLIRRFLTSLFKSEIYTHQSCTGGTARIRYEYHLLRECDRQQHCGGDQSRGTHCKRKKAKAVSQSLMMNKTQIRDTLHLSYIHDFGSCLSLYGISGGWCMYPQCVFRVCPLILVTDAIVSVAGEDLE